MAEAETQATRGPRPGVALAFALAALASSWNGLAAPFAVVVAVAAAMLAAGALRRRVPGAHGRRAAAAALGTSLAALALAVVVLLRNAGAVTAELTGEPVVKGRTTPELEEVLSGAAERTRAERSRAAAELDRVPGGRPEGKATPAPAKRAGSAAVGR